MKNPIILIEERDGVFRDRYGFLVPDYRVNELFQEGGYRLEGHCDEL